MNALWLSDDIIEVTLEGVPSKYHVTPLQHVEEGVRNDEIQAGDTAILAGNYMIIVVPSDDRNPQLLDYIMTNYLKVRSLEEQNFSRRGIHRSKGKETRLQCVIR